MNLQSRFILKPAVPLLAVVLGLAACGAYKSPMNPNPGKVANSCQADANHDLVGQQGTVLGDRVFTAPFRLIHAGDAVTMDHNPSRTNVQLDRRNKVERVFCG